MESAATTRSLDAVRMCAATTDAHGVAGRDTIVVFSEREHLVSATYAGGRIRQGLLLGLRAGTHLTFRYIQIDVDGRLDAGRSTAELNELPDGRLQLVEHFQWETRPESGRNVFEEVIEDCG